MYSNPSAKQYGSRVPRRYVQTIDLDDYLQLQLLLQQEKERRQAIIAEQERRRAVEQEYRHRLGERRQLEDALGRLYYVQQIRQQQLLEEERRIRRERRYRAELMAALQAAKEEEHRRRVLEAIERQKLWEAARIKRQDSICEQRKACSEEDRRRANLEALLKHLFGQPEAEQEEESDEDKAPESLGEEGPAWKIYYRPKPNKLRSVRKSPARSTQSTGGRQERLKDHVIPLQTIIESLLERSDTEEQPQQQKDFENFISNVFPGQQQSASNAEKKAKSTEPEQPAAPAMSEKDAASKIENWYKSAHDSHAISQVTRQLGVLSEIAAQLDKIQSEREQSVFNAPLTFNNLDAAELSNSSGSRNWLQYEDEIMKVLVKLDTIESHGSDVIRDRRKELVKRASALLDRLDEYKHDELERVSIQSEVDDSEKVVGSEAGEKPEPYAIPEAVESEPQQPEINQEASASATAVEEPSTDATAIPLPTPNHPHPENPNATTVDDADGEDDDVVVKQQDEEEFVVV